VEVNQAVINQAANECSIIDGTIPMPGQTISGDKNETNHNTLLVLELCWGITKNINYRGKIVHVLKCVVFKFTYS